MSESLNTGKTPLKAVRVRKAPMTDKQRDNTLSSLHRLQVFTEMVKIEWVNELPESLTNPSINMIRKLIYNDAEAIQAHLKRSIIVKEPEMLEKYAYALYNVVKFFMGMTPDKLEELTASIDQSIKEGTDVVVNVQDSSNTIS